MYFHITLIPRGAYFLLPLESKQEATSGWNFTKCISEVKVNQLIVKNIHVKMGISIFKFSIKTQFSWNSTLILDLSCPFMTENMTNPCLKVKNKNNKQTNKKQNKKRTNKQTWTFYSVFTTKRKRSIIEFENSCLKIIKKTYKTWVFWEIKLTFHKKFGWF